jgi:hypothetical protein
VTDVCKSTILGGLLIALVGSPCLAREAPNLAQLQAAYEREASAGEKKAGGKPHDKGLKIVAARCLPGSEPTLVCSIDFVSSDDPDGRLYLDIIAVTETGDTWTLKSGLCRR